MKFERLMLMSITRAIAGAALVAALFAAPVCAEEGGKILVITQAWSRATPGGAKIAGGYLTIQNMGNVSNR
jgi:copper(I)-binding protein